MGGGGVKNHRKLRDVIYGQPLILNSRWNNPSKQKPENGGRLARHETWRSWQASHGLCFVRDHSNNTWHFLTLFRPPPPPPGVTILLICSLILMPNLLWAAIWKRNKVLLKQELAANLKVFTSKSIKNGVSKCRKGLCDNSSTPPPHLSVSCIIWMTLNYFTTLTKITGCLLKGFKSGVSNTCSA